jgi:hypothetical protein
MMLNMIQEQDHEIDFKSIVDDKIPDPDFAYQDISLFNLKI